MNELYKGITYKFKILHKIIVENSKNKLEKLQINFVMYVTLLNVFENEGITQVKLSQKIHKDRNIIVRILDKLEELELVIRKKENTDRRIHKLFITEKGIDTLFKANSIIENTEKELLNRISEEEVETISKIINKIIF